MGIRSISIFSLWLMAALAWAAPITPAEFHNQEWKLSKILCPATCTRETKAFFQPYLGSTVSLGPNQLSGKLFDDCAGSVTVELAQQSRQQQIAELKQTLRPKRKFSPAILRLPEQPIGAWVYCRAEATQDRNTLARILSIEQNRVLVLFENHTVLELRN